MGAAVLVVEGGVFIKGWGLVLSVVTFSCFLTFSWE